MNILFLMWFNCGVLCVGTSHKGAAQTEDTARENCRNIYKPHAEKVSEICLLL